MSTGKFKTAGDSVSRAQTVTPHDDDDIDLGFPATNPTAIYLDEAGDVAVMDLAGNVEVYESLAAGVWHRMGYRRVMDTDTTVSAGKIKAGWAG